MRKALALCLAGLLPRLWLAWQDMEFLAGKLTADDFYYYLTIARNLASGNGPTFDGLALTNGFHPLYTLALTPLLAVAGGDRALGVHLALTLVAVLDVLAAAGLYALVARRVSRAAGYVAALAWLANPWAMTTALHGVESSLYVLLALATLAVYLPRAASVWQGQRSALAVGLLAGLTILGRTDGVCLLAAIVLDGLRRAWPQRAGRRAALRGAAMVIGAAVLVTLPWWLWNLATFGSIMQVSGQAIARHWHGKDWLQPAAYLAGTANALRRFGMRLVVYLAQVWPLLVVAGATLIPAFSPAGKRSSKSPSLQRGGGRGEGGSLSDLFAPVAYAILLLAWYILYFWQVQNWYLMPVLLVASLAVGYAYPALERAAARLGGSAALLTGGYLVLSGLAIFAVVWLTRGFGYPRQADGLRIAEWVNANVAPAEQIGVWNAGIVGYHSERTVVNLDGVVNNDLYAWVSERNLPLQPSAGVAYARERGLAYVADYEDILAPLAATPQGAGLVEAARLPGGAVVYRVQAGR